MLKRFLALAVVLLPLFACGDSNSVANRPELTIDPASLLFDYRGVGRIDVQSIEVDNTGSDTLRIESIQINVEPAGVIEAEVTLPLDLEPGQGTFIDFRYTPENASPLSGEIVLVNNADGERSIDVQSGEAAPRPDFFPPRLDFGTVPEGTINVLERNIINVGTAPLVVCDVQLSGAGVLFSTDVIDAVGGAVDEGVGYAVIDSSETPFGVGVDEIPFTLTYSPSRPSDVDEATLLITYDLNGSLEGACADGQTDTRQFPVTGRAVIGDLVVSPCPLDFGLSPIDITSREVMSLQNVENLAVTVNDLRFDQERTTPDVFSLEDLPEFPLALDDENNLDTFTIGYRPFDETSAVGTLLVDYTNSNGEPDVLACEIVGTGVEPCAPEALAAAFIREDPERRRSTQIDWAVPLQTAILDGSEAFDPCGEDVVDYVWEIVSAPEGAITAPRPSQSVGAGTPGIWEAFLPISGRYDFRLTVFNESGLSNIEPAIVSIVALPDQAVSIELTWRTPNDPDESDFDGSDADLHVVKLGYPWFDPRYDIFYGNVENTWDTETPSLDRDDTDGGGPETFNMNDPADCAWYAVGVHYFREAFGTAYATVRVFADGSLRYEAINEPLRDTDYFWDVARVHWPSGTVFPVNEVIENFNSEDGITPMPTEAMLSSGLCGPF